MSGDFDVSPIGVLAAQAMERIAEHFGEEQSVRTVAIVVEVDQADCSSILVVSDEDRPWVQIAFLDAAITSLEDHLAALRGEE